MKFWKLGKRSLWNRKNVAATLAILLVLQAIFSASPWLGGRAAAAGAPKYITFLYDDFSQNASRLQFNGSAGVPQGDKVLRLTKALPDQSGSVFNKEKVSLQSSGFSTYFTFKLTNQGGQDTYAPGADGLVFTLQTSSSNPKGEASGIGYENIPTSIGIEFDTYNNGTDRNDPSDNHIAVDFNGHTTHGAYGNPAAVDIPKGTVDFKSGSTVYAWIDYSSDTEILQVYLSKTTTRPATPSLTQHNVKLRDLLQSDDVYAGFTSTTGAAWENHDIGVWYFTNRYDPIDLNSNTYVEAPSIFAVTTSVVNPEASVTDAVYYRADVTLKNSKDDRGQNIALAVSNTDNATFVDPDDNSPLPSPPELQTDENGQVAYLFTATNPGGVLPKFRISTEFGAYQDIRFTTKAKVDTGDITPLYTANAPNSQGASAKVNLLNTGEDTVTSWGIDYRVTAEDGGTGVWSTQTGPSVLEQSGQYTVNLSGLKEDTFYEARAFATNSKGTSYGPTTTFIVQMPMAPDDVKYTKVGPSKIYVDDAESVQVVGKNLFMLLKKRPYSDLTVTISGNGQTYAVPFANLTAVGTTGLTIKFPTKLPLGTYDLTINHAYFGDKTFEDAFTITDDVAYRSINYDEVVVENKTVRGGPYDVDAITLRGPFVLNASEPNVYRLRDANSIVTLNDNLLFKGTELVVDKTDPNRDVIRGQGRLYVNGKNTIPILSTYTIYEGSFEFDPEHFSFKMPTGLLSTAADLTGMGLPVSIDSFTFIKGGIRIKGNAEVSLKAGSTKISGGAQVDALDFLKNRFDLAANFKIGADFKAGPLESGEVRFAIDTHIPAYGGGASVMLKKANVGFDIDLLIKDKQLDSISFAVSKQIKIGSTGAQITKIGGGISNMSSKAEAPLTLSVLGGLSDYITPKIDNTYMVNGNDLRVDLSANYFGASGSLALYKIKVADVDLFIVFNPTGYKGYNQAGFDMSANVNLLDILVGSVVAKYFQNTAFTGYAKAAVQIPRSVPLVGGQKLTSAEVGVDQSKFRAALSVIGIAFKVTYPFSTKSFDWDVDLSSTIKNVASAVVNTGKKIISAVSSWFWYDDPSQAGEWTAADAGDVPGIVGEKLFGSSGIRATALGTYAAGKLTTVAAETNPSIAPSGDGKFVHSFVAGKSYPALIEVKGASADSLRLVAPGGAAYELRTEDDGKKLANVAVIDSDGTVVIEANLTPGTWKLEAPGSLDVTVYEELFRNDTLALPEVAGALVSSTVRTLVPIDMPKRGKYLVEIDKTSADATLFKQDGRPYASEAATASAGYNTYWDAEEGKLYMLVEVPAAGRWLADAGADAKVSLYRMASGTTMSEAVAWIHGSEFVTAANFAALKNMQVLLEIDGASANTKLYRPDGTEYPFETNSASPDWNAQFDADKGVIHALVDVDQNGIWLVKSNGFTDVFGLTLSQKTTMAELNAAGVTYTYNMQINKKGKYLFEIAGGDANTKLFGVDGKPIAIDYAEESSTRNAILNEDALLVTVDVPSAGKLKIQTNGAATIQQYELAPIPKVSTLSAAAQPQRNTYQVTWRVDDAKPDTKVSLIMANDPNEPVGQVLASDLPASGVRTITLPEGNLPANYYLALVADSEMAGPIFKTLDQPLTYQAAHMLDKPTAVQAKAIGNGDIEVSFTDTAYEGNTSYRIYPADENGNVDYNGTSFEGSVDKGAGTRQRVILSGLDTEKSYRFRVMAIKADYGIDPTSQEEIVTSLSVSELSDAAPVTLPKPNPPKIGVRFAADDQPVTLHTYYPYDVKDSDLAGLTDDQKQELLRTLAVTASENVKITVTSDQNVTAKLYVNGEEATAENGDPTTFDLGQLDERVYELDIEAVNASGDKSTTGARLVVDRTAPYLYLKTPVNGEIVDGSRVRLDGATEAGVTLTVNGTVVPVDAVGHFVYYATIPEAGSLPLDLIATDDSGNETVYKLEVLSNGEDGEPGTAADLAAFGTNEGVLVTPFLTESAIYDTSFDSRTQQVRVSAVPIDPNATVTIDGKPVDDQHSAWVDIAGRTSIDAVVEAPGGVQKTYKLQIVAEESALAGLRALDIGGYDADNAPTDGTIELSSGFNSAKLSYEAEVENGIASVRVTPTAAVDGSLIRVKTTVNEEAKYENVTSGQASSPIALDVGENEFEVEVLSPREAAAATPDWTLAKTYQIKISRLAGSQSELRELQVAGATLTPGAFDSAVHDYSARVAADVGSVQLSFAAADSKAAVTLNDTVKGSAGTETVNLTEGANRFVLNVRAQNGSNEIYTLVVYRDKPLAAGLLLSELTVQNQTLTSEFSPWVRNYAVKDSTLSTKLSIVAKPEVPGSIVKVNGQPVDEDGKAEATLTVGANSVLVQVESPDKTETNVYSIGVTRGYSGSGGEQDAFAVKVNDGENDKIAVAKTSEANGVKTMTVVFQKDETLKLLESEGQSPVITIGTGTAPNRLTVELTADLVKKMQEKEAIVLIDTGSAYYSLPASALRIGQIDASFAPDSLGSVTVRIEARIQGEDEQEAIRKQAAKTNAAVIGEPTDFSVTYTYNGRTIAADQFASFIERGLALPEGTAPDQVTTGVRILEDGTFYHVPTYVKKVGERNYAVINSFSNSVYALIHREATFSDVTGRWSQSAIEDLASRTILNGDSDGSFKPTRSVTRAEFAAMIVRALGLPAKAEAGFGDVKASDWYAPYVGAAKSYGLIGGYPDGTFRPQMTITRAEAVSILAKAWTLAGKSAVSESEGALTLEGLTDQDAIPAWARASFASAIQTGLLSGYEDGSVKPLRTVTREETAAMLRNLLIRSDLIEDKSNG